MQRKVGRGGPNSPERRFGESPCWQFTVTDTILDQRSPYNRFAYIDSRRVVHEQKTQRFLRTPHEYAMCDVRPYFEKKATKQSLCFSQAGQLASQQQHYH
jgi:hypothetical protein